MAQLCAHPLGCTKPRRYSDGFCSTHHKRMERFGELGPSGEWLVDCQSPACDAQIRKGYKWCKAHAAEAIRISQVARTRKYRESRGEAEIHRGRRYSAEWRRRNPEKLKNQHRAARFKKYGLTEAEFLGMLENQQGRCGNPACAVTDPIGRGWHIDHCHTTGAVRGILCHHCNVAAGNAKDDPQILRGLADYLERHMVVAS